jgi:hypothetical protein
MTHTVLRHHGLELEDGLVRTLFEYLAEAHRTRAASMAADGKVRPGEAAALAEAGADVVLDTLGDTGAVLAAIDDAVGSRHRSAGSPDL